MNATRIFFIATTIILLITSGLNAQNTKPKKLFKTGQKEFSAGNFPEALENFENGLESSKSLKKKTRTKVHYLTAESYFTLRDYQNAEIHYLETITNDKKKKNHFAYFQLANTLKYQAKYPDAKNFYKDYLNLTSKNKKVDFERRRARLEIKGCELGDTLVVENPLFEVSNPGDRVNGIYADFGPAIRGNNLVFSKIRDIDGEEKFARIYYSEMYNNKFNNAQLFSEAINEANVYTGDPSFTPDGNTIYFTRCSFPVKQEKNCKIFTSSIVNGKWQTPVELNKYINAEGSNSMQPHIYVDEKGKETLFFVSDRTTGRGGKDIWFAEKNENGEFGRPKNMGYPINTAFDEVSPFYDAAGNTFYFSSNGHISLGGFDIFSSSKDDDDKWSEPVNMLLPVNSSVDDYDFVLNENSELGFLTSNRPGTTTERSITCCDDIFMLKSTVINLYVKGLVYIETENSRFVIDNAKVIATGNNKNEQIFDFTGNFFNFKIEPGYWYEVTAQADGYESKTVKFSTLDLTKSDTLYYDIFLKEKLPVAVDERKIIGTIYYEFGKAQLTADAPKTLAEVVEFLKTNSKTIIEIAAHTDSLGDKDINLKVSKQRSEAARNYLISQGIDKNRLISKWYGMEKPKAPNTKDDGSDNPEGRALNRRTEFIIIDKQK